MPTAHTVIGAAVVAACRVAAVATAAGVASGTWSDASFPRVFAGLGGLMKGRNRGRLPFLEVDIQGHNLSHLQYDGGTQTASIAIVCHVQGADWDTSSALAYAILAACSSAIRDPAAAHGNLLALGNDVISPLDASPWGCKRVLTGDIEVSYQRSSVY